MSAHPISPLLLCLVLLLPSCGGGADPAELTRAGYSQLNSGNAQAAQTSFERALTSLQPGDPDYVRASLGLAQVLAAQDPARAKQLFLDLSAKGLVQEGDFRLVAGALVSARHFEEATALVQVGMTAFPESPRMAELRDYVGDSALKMGSEVPAALKGLGYVGSD